MDFYEVLAKVIEILQREGRTSYRALKRQFDLDDEYLEDLKIELIEVRECAVDRDNRMLVWAGETEATSLTPSQTNQPEPQPVVEQAKTAPVKSPPVEPRIPDAERRQLTVMFCDLVGSTSLSGELDPEDYREVVREYQKACTDVIQRYDGHVAQLLGDGLLVYFGFPQAHEDDAQRAIHTGLGILNAIGELNTRLEQTQGVKLAVRLGIHTGLVVIGEMGGEGRQEQLALGETPNVAARIQGIAAPNSVVISDATYRLVQVFFDAEPLGEHDLRGVAQPIAVYRVLHESGAQSRLDIASTRGLTPLIGRESESTLLFERWEQAKGGNGQVFLLSGEAGIGKSRLIQALKEHAAEGTHIRLECRSSPYFTNSALYPIIDMVQRTLRFQTDDTSEQKLEKLEQNLCQYRLPLEESIPLFASLLSLAVPEERYPTLNLTPQRQRQKTLEAILATVLELSEWQPVVFILEDLHWSDPTTLEFLDLLIAQIPTASVYALLTHRPEFQPIWGNHSYLTQVTLNRLSRDDVEHMVERITDGKPLPLEVMQQIIEKTDAVPLYVEECTKAVLESGSLKEIDGRYELVGTSVSLTIPATLQDSLMARLDRLVTAKAVAQYAAVIGRQFSYDLLHAVSELDETTLQRELERLVDAELVYQRGVIPNATYIFKHALVQDTAYKSLLRRTKQGYHRRIAEVLEKRFPETGDVQPELLAHHWTEAGLNVQAVGYWQRAGEKAIQRSANLEAVGHLTRGLTLIEELSAGSERIEKELNVLTHLGPALIATKGPAAPEVEPVYARAYSLCQEMEDNARRFSVLRGLSNYYIVQGKLGIAYELAEQGLRLAQRLQDVTSLMEAHWLLGGNLFFQGEYPQALVHVDQGLALCMPDQARARHVLQYPDIGCLGYAAQTLWILGYPDRAKGRIQEALALAQQLAHPYSMMWSHHLAAMLYNMCHDVRTTQEHAEACIRLATEQGVPFFAAGSTMFQGSALARQGQIEEGIRHIRQGFTGWRGTGALLAVPRFLAHLGEAYGLAGQVEEGLTVLSEALEHVDETGENHYQAEIHRLKGELLLQQSPDTSEEAESCFRQAITIAQNQSAKSWELRAATSLARLWQTQDKRDEARELLEPVYGWFTEGFDTADLIDAKALWVELEEGR